jgi:hypothetical protein
VCAPINTKKYHKRRQLTRVHVVERAPRSETPEPAQRRTLLARTTDARCGVVDRPVTGPHPARTCHGCRPAPPLSPWQRCADRCDSRGRGQHVAQKASPLSCRAAGGQRCHVFSPACTQLCSKRAGCHVASRLATSRPPSRQATWRRQPTTAPSPCCRPTTA